MVHVWSISYAHYADHWQVHEVKCDKQEDIEAWMQERAKEKGRDPLDIESFTDEIHAFFKEKNGKRRRFMNVQYEGTEQ